MKTQQVKDLEQKIEWHISNIKYLNQDSRTYKVGSKAIKMYALQYKELTGEYYRREWD